MRVKSKVGVLCVVFAVSSYLLRAQKPFVDRPGEGKSSFIEVEKDVKLQVIDWGGTGRPLILLAGLGARARAFHDLAPSLVDHYHIWSITRRGFDPSSIPETGYSADRLGDDVVAVIDALKLSKVVLGGHSMAGEELSSIANRHPEKVSGLIYLDAAYSYALYDTVHGSANIDVISTIHSLEHLRGEQAGPEEIERALKQLSLLETNLNSPLALLRSLPNRPPGPPPPKAGRLILSGQEKFTTLPDVPILAFYAYPPNLPLEEGLDPVQQKTVRDQNQAMVEKQIEAFRRQVPHANVVILPNANHTIWHTNKDEVVQAIEDFATKIPL